MSRSKTILKNIGVLSIAEILTYIISFILVVAISRFLGSVGLGKYSFAFAFIGIFAVISDWGISTFSVRNVSRDKEKAQKYFSNYLSLKIIISFITFIIPILIILSTKEPFDVKLTVFFASLAMTFNYLSYSFRFLFNAFEKFEYQSLSLISERIVALIIGLFLLFNGFGVIALAITMVISNFVGLLVNAIFAVKNFVHLKLEFDFKFWKFLLICSIPFWLSLIFRVINFGIDTVMLSFMKSYTVTGIYNAAYKLIDAFTVIPFLVVIVLFPTMSKLFKESKKTLQIVYKKSFYYLFILALPICLGITLLAYRIIIFIYKEQFLESVIALQILVWALIFLFLNYLMGSLLNSINLQRLFAIITFIGASVNIILNFILISIYSFKGAAAATIVTGFLNFILLYYFSTKNNFKVNLISIASKPIFASIIMGIFLIILKNMHILILVPLSALVYFASLIVIGAIGKEELDLIKNFIKKT